MPKSGSNLGQSSDFSAFNFKSSFGQLSRASTRKLGPGLEWVYFIQALVEPYRIKIGKTHNLRLRLMNLQWMSPVPLAYLGAYIWPKRAELIIHQCFKDLRSHGEWFYPGDKLVDAIEAMGDLRPITEGRSLLIFLSKYVNVDVEKVYRAHYVDGWLGFDWREVDALE